MNVLERLARVKVTERSGSVCEGCARAPAVVWTTRSGFRLWCPSNWLYLCRPCAAWVREWPGSARFAGWLLDDVQDPAVEPACLAAWGWVRLRPDGGLTALSGLDGRKGPRGKHGVAR